MAVTRLAFQLQDGDNVLDLAKALSAHHRTLVRQKQIFTVMGGMIVDNPSSSKKITVSTAPNSWYTRAAVNRAFKAWKDMRSKALGNAEVTSGTGRYADFKVFLNNQSSSTYRDAIATGSAGSRPALASNEWSYSKLEDEQANDTFIQIIGDHSASARRYSATMGWITTRALPEGSGEPEMPDLDGDGNKDYKADFISNMHDSSDGQIERLDLAFDENDQVPFGLTELYADTSNGNNTQLQCLTYVSDNNPNQMIPGFEALCGLVHVHVETGSTNPIFFIDVESRGRKF